MSESTERTRQVRQLWDSLRHGSDSQARGQLIEHYMPFAQMLAAKAFGVRADAGARFDDYLQYARVGLIEAVDRYDVTRNVSFESYSSHRIRGAILNGLQQDSELLAQRSFWRARLNERTESLLEATGSTPERASLQDLIDVTVGLALGMMLDGGEGEGEGEPIDEQPCSNPYAMTEMQQLAGNLRTLLQRLPEREREIVHGHYFEQREFQAIASAVGVTKGRISQLHAKALSRLRGMLDEKPQVDAKL